MFRQAILSFAALTLFSSCSLAQLMNNNPLQRQSQQSSRLSGQDTFNSLSGTVRTSDNKPLKDVRVELRDAQTGSNVGSTYTSSSGTFEFPRINSGVYEVIATSGLEAAQERVEVHGMSSMVNLRMPVSSVATDGNGQNSISVAQYKVPEKAREELKKAKDASAKQKLDEAQKHIAKALEIYPKYADALTLRGILKLDAKDQDGAVADLQQALEYDSNDAMTYLVMGAALNMKGKYDDAIRALERGEALSPNSWQAYFEMSKSLVGKAQYEPALRQLDRAQALAPTEYPLIHLVRAHALLALNNYAEAMTELQAYLDKEPKGPNSQQAQKMLAQAKAFAASHPAK
ncbi:MAG: hypothetical protein DMG65_26100 [Candidatus Angelobacter sp. Gp1-AA117]|nr:MAG: hypothetical protein DMG65_26100 [Candidatus Angelobacter sp. Gp1-AA117]